MLVLSPRKTWLLAVETRVTDSGAHLYPNEFLSHYVSVSRNQRVKWYQPWSNFALAAFRFEYKYSSIDSRRETISLSFFTFFFFRRRLLLSIPYRGLIKFFQWASDCVTNTDVRCNTYTCLFENYADYVHCFFIPVFLIGRFVFPFPSF